MKYLSLHCRGHSLFAEKRLCFQIPGGESPEPPVPEDIQKRNDDAQKQSGEKNKNDAEQKEKTDRQNKRKALRAELAKLSGEIKIQAQSKEKLDELRKKQQSLNFLLGSANNQELIREIAQDMSMPDLEDQLRQLADTKTGQEAIKRITTGLNALNSGVGFEQYTSEDGIMKFARDIIGSDIGSNVLSAMRERGLTIQNETIIRILFIAMRGFAASAFSTSRFFNAFPELREKGRQFHYRIALEAQVRSQGGSVLNMTELVTRPIVELKLLALGQNADASEQRWYDMYEAWRTIAQRNRQSSMSAAVPPLPTIAQAMNEKRTKDYIAAVNGTPTPTPTSNPTEIGQARQLGGLDFPADGIVRVEGTPRVITHNAKQVKFERNSDNHFLVKMQPDFSINRVIKFADAAGQEADALKLKAVPAVTTTGDVEVVASKGNVERTVKVSQLAQAIEQNPTRTKIIITDNNRLNLL